MKLHQFHDKTKSIEKVIKCDPTTRKLDLIGDKTAWYIRPSCDPCSQAVALGEWGLRRMGCD